MKIREITLDNYDGTFTTYVIEEYAPNQFTSMTKEKWDEKEAQKELGGRL
jgi:hypothetical protein